MTGPMTGMGGRVMGSRTSSAAGEMRGGATWLRRTFAVGRLTRGSAELRIARRARWSVPGPKLVSALLRGPSRGSSAAVH
jgi:hypothetical protein